VRAVAAFVFLASAGLLTAGLVGAGASSSPPADVASSADVEKGREIYERCGACHSLERDRVGPRHCGLFGRRAGSVPGFVYSDAMRESRLVWGRKTLDRFLTNPLAVVPGTFMGYAGIPDPKEREQLLDYLDVATRGEQCDAAAGSAAKTDGDGRGRRGDVRD